MASHAPISQLYATCEIVSFTKGECHFGLVKKYPVGDLALFFGVNFTLGKGGEPKDRSARAAGDVGADGA